MTWEEIDRKYAEDQARIKVLADDMGDSLSVYTVSQLVNDWIKDPAEDLAVLCTMANAYGASGDFEELGRHVSNYVRGLWELIAKHKVDCTLPQEDDDENE